MFDHLEVAPPDPILGLEEAFKRDTNPAKINLAAGVYRDDSGSTPVLRAVKRAEAEILEHETSKSYLPIVGSPEYAGVVQQLVFGPDHPVIAEKRAVTVHAPGGTGALRVGADIVKRANASARVWISQPTWPNHPGVMKAAGLDIQTYPYFDAANNCLDCGSRPIFLGGDHAISMGSVAGLARHCRAAARELFVLWIDAHGDFNTPETSQTGNLHGMVLALLCGEPVLPTDDSWFAPIDPRNVAILGARSLDRDERNLLAARGVQIIDMRTIDEFGVVAPLRRFLTRVSHANGHLHVSLDLDAMDPAIAPGVGTPVPGGLSFREAHLVMELLHDSGVVGSLDLIELNPFLDHAGTSARLLVDLTASLFGQQIIERSRQGRARQPHMRRRALSLTAPEK